MLNVKKTLTKILTSMFGKTLYDSTKVTSGTLILADAYTNYDFLVISYMTNVDRFAKVFDCAQISANPTHSFLGDVALNSSGTWYASTCNFKPTDSTHLAVSNFGNNVNYVAGIVKVVGIKIPFIGGVLLKGILNILTPCRKAVGVC